jgi:hypothetical protein
MKCTDSYTAGLLISFMSIFADCVHGHGVRCRVEVISGDVELITDKRLRPKIYGDERSPNPVMALTFSGNGKTLWTKPVFGEHEPVWGEFCQVCNVH